LAAHFLDPIDCKGGLKKNAFFAKLGSIKHDEEHLPCCLVETDILIRRMWCSSIRLELQTISDLSAIRCNKGDAMPNGEVIPIAVAGVLRAR